MDIITIDFETFYTFPYRLKTYTTENYIRCDAFEVIGVSVQVNEGEPVWFSGTAKDTEKFLKSYDWENSIGLAHNAMFDMAILGWRFNIHPKRIADTLGMARAIHGVEVGGSLGALAAHYGVGVKGTEVLNAVGMRRLDFTPEQLHRYGEYCKNDTALTYRLFHAMAPGFPVIELRLIDLTLRMFTQPVITLGVPGLTAHLDAVRTRKLAFTESAGVTRKDLMSNDKLAELLRALGVVPPTKISAATGKEAFAFAKTDEEFKALLEHYSDTVQALVAARLGVKSTLEETRTQRFIDIAARGALPIPLRYYAAHTGRWGGDDKVNIQNLPRASPLKMALLAPEGYVLIDSDSSQIEARTLAWLAGQNDLVAAFDRGEDVYKIMASAIYGKAVDEISKGERFVGKTTVLGCFGAATKVLTNYGWKCIVEVNATDMLWDGEEWVTHQGVVQQGVRETTWALGVDATPEHEILTAHGWRGWLEVTTNPSLTQSAIDRGNLPSPLGYKTLNLLDVRRGGTPLCDAPVGGRGKLTDITLKRGALQGVARAQKSQATQLGNTTGGTKVLSRMRAIVCDCLTAFQVVFRGAITRIPKRTPTTEVGAFLYTPLGALTGGVFYSTLSPSTGGPTQRVTSTGSTITKGMNQTTSGLLLAQRTQETREPLRQCKRRLMTYDIAYAGPRNRYTIATDAGPMLAHNCGYGMGAAKFQAQLKTFGVELPQEECERIISVYRSTYPRIPMLWKQAGNALRAIQGGSTAPLGKRGVLVVEGQKGIRLPNGLYLKYPNLRVTPGEKGQQFVYDTRKGKAVIPNRIYGGKVVENCCQALARIIIGEQMLAIAKRYKVVMTVHDAICCAVPVGEAGEGQKFIEESMRMRPTWALELPLNCESGVGNSYGEC